jgi:hypothetical protein
MNTLTLWILIVWSSQYRAEDNITQLGPFATQQDCERVKAFVAPEPEFGYSRHKAQCIEIRKP